MAADGKTVQIPEPWAAAWKYFYDGIWTDHFSMTGPQFETTDLNPAGYPFFAGKVAMSTNYLWSTYGVADAGDDWNMAATPVLQRQDDGRLQRRHVPDPQGQQEPRRRRSRSSSTCSATRTCSTLYGGMPAVESKQDAFLRGAVQATTHRASTGRSPRTASQFADVPNFESFMPAYNQTLDLLSKYGTKWQTTPGLDLTPRSRRLKAEMQAIWDAGGS